MKNGALEKEIEKKNYECTLAVINDPKLMFPYHKLLSLITSFIGDPIPLFIASFQKITGQKYIAILSIL